MYFSSTTYLSFCDLSKLLGLGHWTMYFEQLCINFIKNGVLCTKYFPVLFLTLCQVSVFDTKIRQVFFCLVYCNMIKLLSLRKAHDNFWAPIFRWGPPNHWWGGCPTSYIVKKCPDALRIYMVQANTRN